MAVSRGIQRALRISGTVLVLGATAALWKLTGLGSGGELAREAAPFLYAPWSPALVLFVYAIGAGIAFFPILPLIIATGLLFEPAWAFGYSLGGSMLGALAGYAVGRWIGRENLARLLGDTATRSMATLRDAGLLGVAAVRLFPAAPYSVVGIVAGAVHVRLAGYLLGTLIGLLPGVLVFSLLGYQIRSGERLWLTALTLVAAFLLGGAGWWKARRQRRRKESDQLR